MTRLRKMMLVAERRRETQTSISSIDPPGFDRFWSRNPPSAGCLVSGSSPASSRC
jgi:hypothetical protein